MVKKPASENSEKLIGEKSSYYITIKVRQENGNKLIVFDEYRYAIFDVYEVFILCSRNVIKPRGTVERITKEDILRKYGVLLE